MSCQYLTSEMEIVCFEVNKDDTLARAFACRSYRDVKYSNLAKRALNQSTKYYFPLQNVMTTSPQQTRLLKLRRCKIWYGISHT